MFDEIALMKQLHAPDPSAYASDIDEEPLLDASAHAPNTGEDHTPDTITSVSETTEEFPQNAD